MFAFEGAEGVGVVDDGFVVLAPLEKVVRRAVESQAEAFHLLGADIADPVFCPVARGLSDEAVLDEPSVWTFDTTQGEHPLDIEIKHISPLERKHNRFVYRLHEVFCNVQRLILIIQQDLLNTEWLLFIEQQVLYTVQ